MSSPEPSNTSSPSDIIVNSTVPSNKSNLRLLLVSGKKSDWLVNPTDSIDSVLNQIYSTWPKQGWANETLPVAPSNLKLLLRGKFLEKSSTVQSCGIPVGETTVVHLLIKNDPAPAGNGDSTSNDKINQNSSQPGNAADRSFQCCTLL